MPFHKIFGVDLGTSTIKIYSAQKDTVIKEKNMIAVRNGKEILAVGNKAYEMFEKTPVNIHVNCPMAFGKIANIGYTETVLQSLLQHMDRSSVFQSTVYLTVPTDMSEIERRAYFTIAKGNRKNKVFVVERPIADALALGIPIWKTKGAMIVNIGAQSTEISAVAEDRVIMSKIIEIGGQQLSESICNEIRRAYNLHIGMRTAERLKLSLAYLSKDKKEARKVTGIDSLSGLPRECIIPSVTIYEAIKQLISYIGEAIKFFLERTPPQIYHSIIEDGIYLAGGTTKIPDIEWYLQQNTGYHIKLSDFYDLCTIYGVKEIIHHKSFQKYTR